MKSQLFFALLIATISLFQPVFATFGSTPESEIHVEEFVIAPAQVLNMEEVSAKIKYPAALVNSGVEGEVTCFVLVSETGTYTDHRLQEPYDEQMVSAVIKHLPELRFKPARIGDNTVSQWVTLTFSFRTQE